MGNLLGAVDLGGTKIISGLFSSDGEILGPPVESPTEAHLSPEEVLENICGNFMETLKTFGEPLENVARVGIGVPTTIQHDKGLIDFSPNLPTMTDYPLARVLAEKIGIPVNMEKDANCFVLGERARGAAAGCSDCCGVTLGTGLGVGIVIGGKLLHGNDRCAGEIWKCPYEGDILENHVSGTALVKKYAQATGEKLSGEEIHLRATRSDRIARELFAEMGQALGCGLSYLVNLLNPEVIVIGGSVARAWNLFAGGMKDVIHRHLVERNATTITRSKLDHLAPLYGAALLPG